MASLAKTLHRKITGDVFLRHSAISFSTSLAAAALSYLLHPILARILTLEDYGEVQVLLSLYNNLIVVVSVFSLAVVNIVANTDDHDHGDLEQRVRLVTTLRNIVLTLAATMFVVIVLISGALRSFFRFDSVLPLIVLAFSFPASIPLAFRRAYLRGTKRFLGFGISQVIENAFRVGLAGAMVYAGFRSSGAMAGVVLAQLFAFAYAYRDTRKEFRYVKGAGFRWNLSVRRELRYAGLIFTVTLAMAFFTTGDMLIVKRYFDPATVGLYSGVAIIARIVYYLTGPIAAVLVPSVRIRASDAENRALLTKAIVLIVGIGGTAGAVFALFPSAVIRILVGERFTGNAHLMAPLCLLMIMISVTIPMLSYYVALRRRFVAFFALGGVVEIILLCIADHGSLEAIIRNFMIGLSSLLAAFAVRGLIVGRRLYAGS